MLVRKKPLRAYIAVPLLITIVSLDADGATSSVSYTYDRLGRVATAYYDNGVCVAYTYDASGNRTSQTNTAASTPESPIWGSGVWGCFPWTP